MKKTKNLNIQLLYSIHNKVKIIKLEINKGISIINFIEQIPRSISSTIDLNKICFGVFGKIVQDNYIIEDGDRIEIYEDALIDAKNYRKGKAKK
tara:strand:+ start:62 stop:343 length:282 start_codon:yes stop_codon:yes gene_type:complete